VDRSEQVDGGVGIATIRVNRLISAADLYPVGALAIACGVMILTIRAWIVKKIHGWVPIAFTLSTLVGVVGNRGQLLIELRVSPILREFLPGIEFDVVDAKIAQHIQRFQRRHGACCQIDFRQAQLAR
jgi:hypothetical protein